MRLWSKSKETSGFTNSDSIKNSCKYCEFRQRVTETVVNRFGKKETRFTVDNYCTENKIKIRCVSTHTCNKFKKIE